MVEILAKKIFLLILCFVLSSTFVLGGSSPIISSTTPSQTFSEHEGKTTIFDTLFSDVDSSSFTIRWYVDDILQKEESTNQTESYFGYPLNNNNYSSSGNYIINVTISDEELNSVSYSWDYSIVDYPLYVELLNPDDNSTIGYNNFEDGFNYTVNLSNIPEDTLNCSILEQNVNFNSHINMPELDGSHANVSDIEKYGTQWLVVDNSQLRTYYLYYNFTFVDSSISPIPDESERTGFRGVFIDDQVSYYLLYNSSGQEYVYQKSLKDAGEEKVYISPSDVEMIDIDYDDSYYYGLFYDNISYTVKQFNQSWNETGTEYNLTYSYGANRPNLIMTTLDHDPASGEWYVNIGDNESGLSGYDRTLIFDSEFNYLHHWFANYDSVSYYGGYVNSSEGFYLGISNESSQVSKYDIAVKTEFTNEISNINGSIIINASIELGTIEWYSVCSNSQNYYGGDQVWVLNIVNLTPSIYSSDPSVSGVNINYPESRTFSINIEDNYSSNINASWYIDGLEVYSENLSQFESNHYNSEYNFVSGSTGTGEFNLTVIVTNNEGYSSNMYWNVSVSNVVLSQFYPANTSTMYTRNISHSFFFNYDNSNDISNCSILFSSEGSDYTGSYFSTGQSQQIRDIIYNSTNWMLLDQSGYVEVYDLSGSYIEDKTLVAGTNGNYYSLDYANGLYILGKYDDDLGCNHLEFYNPDWSLSSSGNCDLGFSAQISGITHTNENVYVALSNSGIYELNNSFELTGENSLLSEFSGSIIGIKYNNRYFYVSDGSTNIYKYVGRNFAFIGSFSIVSSNLPIAFSLDDDDLYWFRSDRDRLYTNTRTSTSDIYVGSMTPINDSNNTINISYPSSGQKNWQIVCANIADEYYSSPLLTFTIPTPSITNVVWGITQTTTDNIENFSYVSNFSVIIGDIPVPINWTIPKSRLLDYDSATNISYGCNTNNTLTKYENSSDVIIEISPAVYLGDYSIYLNYTVILSNETESSGSTTIISYSGSTPIEHKLELLVEDVKDVIKSSDIIKLNFEILFDGLDVDGDTITVRIYDDLGNVKYLIDAQKNDTGKYYFVLPNKYLADGNYYLSVLVSKGAYSSEHKDNFKIENPLGTTLYSKNNIILISVFVCFVMGLILIGITINNKHR